MTQRELQDIAKAMDGIKAALQRIERETRRDTEPSQPIASPGRYAVTQPVSESAEQRLERLENKVAALERLAYAARLDYREPIK